MRGAAPERCATCAAFDRRRTLLSVRSSLGHQTQKALGKRHALAVLEEFVGAQAKCLEIGLGMNAGVEISDCVSDIGFKQIAVLRVALVQIKGSDDFHDELTVLFMITWCAFHSVRRKSYAAVRNFPSIRIDLNSTNR
jgi:hypothetical protein